MVSKPFVLKEGEDRIAVAIDPENLVKESDETNNRVTADARDLADPQIDLWITPKDIRSYFGPHGRMVSVRIHSKGKGTIFKVGTSFYLADPEKGGKWIGDGALDMEAGSTAGQASRMFLEEGELGEGKYEIFAVVDPNNLVPETDETNNRASIVLTVGPEAKTQ